jgi:hypothetical protein
MLLHCRCRCCLLLLFLRLYQLLLLLAALLLLLLQQLVSGTAAVVLLHQCIHELCRQYKGQYNIAQAELYVNTVYTVGLQCCCGSTAAPVHP